MENMQILVVDSTSCDSAPFSANLLTVFKFLLFQKTEFSNTDQQI